MNPENIVSAQVMLVAADGTRPSSKSQITSDNIQQWKPADHTVAQVSAGLRAIGFEVGKCVGNSFSITGTKQLFEASFQTELKEVAGGGLRFARGGLELETEKLPPAFKAQIASIMFTAPPAFGPGATGAME